MAQATGGETPIGDADEEAAVEAVQAERDNLREFIKELSADDIKTGGWFTKLIARALATYTDKATWEYFQDKYQGVPADVIVDQRIKMASRYAALEGGLSAGAYTAAIVATLGTLGGASPATVPAAISTLVIDLAFVTQLQLRLAYDIAVLYRVPVDVTDPDDLWKLIRVAFTIKSGEAAREGVLKIVPAMARPLIKRYYARGALAAGKGLPVVGKYLLQRNVIKVGIPLVGVPLAVVLNRYTTLIAGRHARAVYRNEARVIEAATKLAKNTGHPQLLLWVAWLVVNADKKISDGEALLMRHLVASVHEHHEVLDEELREVVDIDVEEVLGRLEAEDGDLSDLVEAAERVAAIDGELNKHEDRLLDEIRRRTSRPS
jgi:tellurite resistance protein